MSRLFQRDPDASTRSWPRRLLIVFNVILASVLIAGVAGLGYTKWRFGQIDKLSFASGILRDDAPGNVMNVLLVGSDSREELAPGQSESFGSSQEISGKRSDTIMILHVDPKAQRAAILSIPRDMWVTIADTKGKQRINTAYEGGPERLIKTIQQNFNIPIDHFVEVNFDGFKGIVQAVGGVNVRIDAPARDKLSGLNITQAGCVSLSGDQALAYVRSRHYESYESGRWRVDGSSDLGRIDRQQDFIRRMIRKSIDKGARNPLTLDRLIDAGVENVSIDEGLSLGDIAKLGRRFQSLDANEVQMMRLPGKNANVNGASVLQLVQPDADRTIDQFLNGPPKVEDANVPPSTISVRVLNGSGVSGQASEAANELKLGGFVVNGTGDAGKFANNNTTIRYAKGQKAKADTLAKWVQGKVTATEDTALRGVDIVLSTGTSFEGIVEPGKAPVTTTTSPEDQKPQPAGAPDENAC